MKSSKKSSVRTKLFITFAVIMLMLIICMAVASNMFLEKYYIYREKDVCERIAAEVWETIDLNADASSALMQLARDEVMAITVADRNLDTSFTSSAQLAAGKPLPQYMRDLIKNHSGSIASEPLYVEYESGDIQPRLLYICMRDDGEYLVLAKNMLDVRTSIEFFSQFYLIVCTGVFVLGAIVLLVFSSVIAKPIREMSEIAQSISDLDFKRKVENIGNDELGVLASSINSMSDRLEDNIRELEEDVEFQQTLVRNVSHDLKAPIGVVKGYAEGLMRGVASSPEKREHYLQVIVNECENMDVMVGAMLYYSRLSAKEYKLADISYFPIERLYDDVISRFSHEIATAGIKLVEKPCDGIVMCGGYEFMFNAVSNLVANAIKFCGGDKTIVLEAANTDDAVSIIVANTCQPLPNSELSKIFEVFYKIDKSRGCDTSGHGLGLSIVKRIAELHGGSVLAQNTLDGVEFIITIPHNRQMHSPR